MTRSRCFNRGVCIALALQTAAVLAADSADWPRWRGANDDGVAPPGKYPVKWAAEKVLWKTPLPGKGCSTPVVWKERIYLTAPIEGKDAMLAFDAAGKLLWMTSLGVEQAGKHRNGSGCNASPVTDGRSVFAYFKSGTLAALDFDGKVRWQTNLVDAFGRDTLFWDHGTSPVLTEKSVIMVRMHHGESWLAAFDKSTGAMEWKEARNFETPLENDNSYATPLVLRRDNKECVLVWGGEHLTLHDAANGKLFWSAEGFNPVGGKNWPAVASSVVAGDIAMVAHGRSDRGNGLYYGVKVGGAGGTNHVWSRNDTGTFVPTPAVWRGNVFLLRDRGEVECLDPVTGKTIWSDGFPKTSANFYGSPLIADGKLYAVREDGVVFVAGVDGKFELLAENRMGERIVASPVGVGGRLFLRGENNLYCIAGE
ncbi:MAG: PQQ-binding-like beta-propeller repeat protein [Verrucomicrobia bacterium]|nr:PQQ-binding-like beta-propeller repeat protein [Verrucomicrobiota bacterium]